MLVNQGTQQLQAPTTPTPALSVKTPKLNSLQAYRGIAALLVILLHASKEGYLYFHYAFLGYKFAFGYSGVDFFFVLSGFIILQMHHQDLGQPARWRQYASKRLIRVFPIYWLMMLIIIPVYFINPDLGTGYERTPGAIIKSLCLIPQTHFPVLSVAWTLCHEVWFYLLFLLAIVAPRRLTQWCAAALLTASFGCWLLTLTIARERTDIAYSYGFALSSYNLEFALGCLGSYLLRHYRLRHGNLLLGAGLVLFLTAAIFDVPLRQQFGNTHRILSYGFASFLIVIGSVARELDGRLTVPRLATYLGDASYSIYLTHLPLLSCAALLALKFHLLNLLGPFLTVTLMIAAVITAGCGCYTYIEKPLLTATRKTFLSPLPKPLPTQRSDA